MNAINGAASARAGSAEGNLCAYRTSVQGDAPSPIPRGLASQSGAPTPPPVRSVQTVGRGRTPSRPRPTIVTDLYPVPLAIPGAPEWLPAVEAYRAAA